MDWLDYLIENLVELLIAALLLLLIAWAIADIAKQAARVTLCVLAVATITGILYTAFTTVMSVVYTGMSSSISSIDGASGGKLFALLGAVFPTNMDTCVAIVMTLMVARWIYDWNSEFIMKICSG